MELVIKINTDNIAFEGRIARELKRILGRISRDQLADATNSVYPEEITLRDRYGNKVGSVAYVPTIDA